MQTLTGRAMDYKCPGVSQGIFIYLNSCTFGVKVRVWKEVVGKYMALYGERVYFGLLDLFSTRTCVLMEIGDTFFNCSPRFFHW